jgi:uncharacterized repeat protein (TIGR01451 family)
MIALLWLRGSLVYAAPLQQTVPPPTPTPETQPVPTATSVPEDNNDDDSNNNDNNTPPPPAPTDTPVPQPTAAPGLTGVVAVQRLNVRQGPGTNFPVINTVAQGETVTVLSRNPVGDWWRVCCISGTDQDGWVAAQFIQPNFDLGQANVLIAVDGALPTPPPEPTATPTLDPSVIPTATATIEAAQLALQVQQEPPYAWQGATITLIYQVDNSGPVAAAALELRNELPAELTLVSAPALTNGELMTETTDLGRTVVVARWPELQAGATVTASVQVQVAEQMSNGAVLDNLAVVVAENAQPVTAGLSIGMPPTNLPDFR